MSGISPACNDLDPFFDRELTASDAEAYRVHLATCDHCAQLLLGRVLEAAAVSKAAVATAAPAMATPLRKPSKKPRWVWTGAGVAALVAACVALWLHKTPADPTIALAGQLAPERSVDVRFSTETLDKHRPPKQVMRSAPAPGDRESFRLDSLAALEERAPNALVAALALEGNLDKAAERATQLPNTAASLADRAALALLDGDSKKAQANAERALSLARQALRLEPKHPQAMWNEAVALERMQLTRAAAAAFEEIAKRGEPGWSAEAKERAERLDAAYRGDLKARRQLDDAAIAMLRGGAPMADDLVARDASFARLAFHLAVAGTADRARLAELAPLAQQLELAEELAQIRASNLTARAPLAQEISSVTGRLASLLPPRTATELPGFANQFSSLFPAKEIAAPVRDALRALRSRAKEVGHADIARAIALLIEAKLQSTADIAELPSLSAGGPWWRLVAVEREVFYLTYFEHRFLEVGLVSRDVIKSCGDSVWCPTILTSRATSASEIGRLDEAYKLVLNAQSLTRDVGDRTGEGRVFYAAGQFLTRRVVEGLDSGLIFDAYMYESALRMNDCRAHLTRLDWRALTALDYHRFAEAEQWLGEADRLQAKCRKEATHFNRDNVRLRLIAHRPTADRVRQLEEQVRSVESPTPEHKVYNEFLIAAARIAIAGSDEAVAAMHDVIAKAEEFKGKHFAGMAREHGYSVIAEHAARRGAGEDVLTAIAARMGVQPDPGCIVAVNHDDRVTIAVRGADDRVAVEIRELPEGDLMIPPPELIARAMQSRLAGCKRVDVLATGAYFGAARLLPRELRWAYRSSPRRTKLPSLKLSPEVVVTGVVPPAELELPPLRFAKSDPSARVLSGREATPSNALTAMTDAELVRFKVHGMLDVNEPSAASLVLSPEKGNGPYWLTAELVEKADLKRAPVIILEACHAGRVQVSKRPWSLASSFLAAGASAVIAPTVEIPDDDADEVFRLIVERMRKGRSPEQAVAEVREERGDVPWLASVVVFQ